MPLADVYPLVATRTLARPFTYEVPEGVGPGDVVAVRFGRARQRGVVVAWWILAGIAAGFATDFVLVAAGG